MHFESRARPSIVLDSGLHAIRLPIFLLEILDHFGQSPRKIYLYGAHALMEWLDLPGYLLHGIGISAKILINTIQGP
jgi:hypothetical protein